MPETKAAATATGKDELAALAAGTNRRGKTKMRSPGYPGIDLERAIAKAQNLYDNEKRNPTPVSVLTRHWNMTPKNSAALVAIAALQSFGLTRDAGSGEKRTLQLTDLALRILLDQRQDSPEREEAVKKAALAPRIHLDLWKKWGPNLPSDESLRHSLIFDFKFNENSVDAFIKQYKATMRFAKLSESDMLSEEEGDSNQEDGSDMQQQVFTDQQRTQPTATMPKSPAGGHPVGASIPVTKDCTMSILATGAVTQQGIAKLMEYLKLIKDSFPLGGNGE